MVEFGPIQMLAMGFPNQENLHGELISELFRLSDYKIIRMVGFLAIAKNHARQDCISSAYPTF